MVTSKYNGLLSFIAIVFLLALQFESVFAKKPTAKQIIRMEYGIEGVVKYDLKSGTFSIYKDNKIVIYNAYSSARTNNRSISSKDYTERIYSHTVIIDGFGKGQKYVVISKGEGLPVMKQVFYVYPGRAFLLMEEELNGTGLRSNYMAPLTGSFMPVRGDVRSLTAPFDNDTFISYDARPFTVSGIDTSAEVGAVFDNTSRNGIIAGSVEHGTWKTGVRTASNIKTNKIEVWGGYTAINITRDEIAHGEITGK
jgi:alpha-galactosidase